VRFVRTCHYVGWWKFGTGLTFGLEDLLVAVVRGHVPGVLGLAVLLFFVEIVADGFDELLAGLLEVGLWSVCGRSASKVAGSLTSKALRLASNRGL
jgi:hypothetical protein